MLQRGGASLTWHLDEGGRGGGASLRTKTKNRKTSGLFGLLQSEGEGSVPPVTIVTPPICQLGGQKVQGR